MENRDSLDRSSEEAPPNISTNPSASNGPPPVGLMAPLAVDPPSVPNLTSEPSPQVESVMKSDVCTMKSKRPTMTV